MNTTNLQTVVDMLKSMPNEKIDLSQWASPCGTVMCVCGEVAHRGLIDGFTLDNDFPLDGVYAVKYDGMCSWPAVCLAFDIDVFTAKFLFSPEGYSKSPCVGDSVLTSDIIKRIETFIKEGKV